MIEIGKKIYRNLEEQVGQNTKILNLLVPALNNKFLNIEAIYTSDDQITSDSGWFLVGSENNYKIYFGHNLIGPFNFMGVPGPKGDTGIQGEQGVQGPKGDKGEQGDIGLTGPIGQKGDKGDKGEQGDKGDPGENAFLFTIVAKLNTVDELPSPNNLAREYAYLVDSGDTTTAGEKIYDLYIIVGNYPNLTWSNIGPCNGIVSYGQIQLVSAPTYVATSTEILAQSADKGLAVGTDTGHWYYWNGSKYADGGVFISSLDNLKLDLKLDIAPGKNLFDKTRPITASSYVNEAGTVSSSTSEYRVTDYILAKPNTKYQTNIANGAGFIGCYDANLNPLGKCNETANTDGPGYNFTTLNNTAYIRLTYFEASYSANINKAMVIEGDNARLLLSYAKYIKYAQDGNCSLLPFGIRIDQDTFVSPSNIVYDAPCSKKNSIITFTATFTGTLNNLLINHGVSIPYADSFLIIYSDRIEVWGSESGTDNLYVSASHGLTLTESISVIINNYDIAKAKITLTCPSGTFSLDTKWTGYSGQILVRNDTGLTLNNAHFVYSALDLNASVWCFGDSYLDYRPKNIMKMGYTDIMFDGFGGRRSESGITVLRQLLSYKIPKVVLWCLGMNDSDSDSEINSSWQTCANQLVDLSNKYNFEIVFTTIPCTPIINNSFKNTWIKNSGLRYIDVAAAVGGTNVGATWFSGLLSDDNIHPTYNYGEQVIASTIAAGLPEINHFGYPTIDKLDVLNDSMTDVVNSLTVKDGIVLIRYQGTAKKQITNGEPFLAIGGEYYPPEIAGTRLSVAGEIEWAARLFFVSNNNGGIYASGNIEAGQFVSFTFVYFLGSWNDNLNLN